MKRNALNMTEIRKPGVMRNDTKTAKHMIIFLQWRNRNEEPKNT